MPRQFRLTHKSAKNIERARFLRAEAKRVAEQCADAYSYDRYRSWTAVALALLTHGYTARETETIMRSKVTRWAADGTHPYGKTPARVVLPLAIKYYPPGSADLAEGVLETLGPEDEF